MVLHLGEAVSFWGGPRFDEALKLSLLQQTDRLPLQQALTASSSVADTPITIMVLGAEERGGQIRVRAGIFYEGVTGGCACAGDPSPDTTNAEYCVVQIDIDKSSGAASCVLIGN